MFADVAAALGLGPLHRCWEADFEGSASWADRADVEPARGAALASRCGSYGFDASVTREIVAERTSWDRPAVRRLGAHLQWLVWERSRHSNVFALGWPPAPAACPLLYTYALLGLTPLCEAYHRELAVPADVTAATLWDIGQQVALYRRRTGRVGCDNGWWLVSHVTGRLFKLGRLQFLLRSAARPSPEPLRGGEPVLDVHIPELGPLSPELCEQSFAEARDFFPRMFPDHRARWFTCDSWLLDPTLREYLAADSNILRFQARFDVLQTGSGSTLFNFVFDRPDLDRDPEAGLGTLPQETALQRAAVRHVRAGRRWKTGFGVTPFSPS